MAAALPRVLTVIGLGVLPVVVTIAMFMIGTLDDSLAVDFHNELYPQAKAMLRGDDPYPPPDFDPTAAVNFIWPPLDAFGLAPLTLLPVEAADVFMVVLGLVCFALALWFLEVRDWRVYGVFALWPEVAGEMRVSHLTPQLCLFLALAWRFRSARLVPGLLIGLAISVKFFVWPLVAWCLATGRIRAAVTAATLTVVTLLLVVPYGLVDYVRALVQLGEAFDQDSYTVFGLLAQTGFSDTVARSATWVTGAAFLAATIRYRSFAVAIAAALVLSPVVWLDYFALAALPLAISRPRLSWIWFVPLATWGLNGAGLGIGDTGHISRLFAAFGIVLGVAFAAERSRKSRTMVYSSTRQAHP